MHIHPEEDVIITFEEKVIGKAQSIKAVGIKTKKVEKERYGWGFINKERLITFELKGSPVDEEAK